MALSISEAALTGGMLASAAARGGRARLAERRARLAPRKKSGAGSRSAPGGL